MRNLSPSVMIAIGLVALAAAIISIPLLSPYKMLIGEGAVVRMNRLTGEVVVCSRLGCRRLLASGNFSG
jgi:sorbitol-specific phosphotransferase system component IIBC